MTYPVIEFQLSPSQLVANEIRAELARQGRNQAWLAKQLFVAQAWVSRRISPTAEVDLTLEEVTKMAEALNVPVQGLVAAWLPRLDSNQQPSGYLSPLVRRIRRWRRRRSLGPLAVVIELDERRRAA